MFTLEDVNSVNANLHDFNTLYCVDTSLIDKDTDYSEVKYDFIKISRSKSGDNYNFTFEIINKLWAGDYYFTKLNGDYINNNTSFGDGKLYLTTPEADVRLYLYCSGLKDFTTANKMTLAPLNYPIYNSESTELIFYFESLTHDTSLVLTANTDNGSLCEYLGDYIYKVTVNPFNSFLHGDDHFIIDEYHYPYHDTKKSLDWSYSLISSAGANVKQYKLIPSSFEFKEYGLPRVFIDGVETTVYDKNSFYVIEIDHTGKLLEDIKIVIKTNETLHYLETVKELIIPPSSRTVYNMSDFNKALADHVSIIKLGGQITADYTVVIPNNIVIDGQQHNLYLNDHKIIIYPDSTVTFKNLYIAEGKHILQCKNSNVYFDNVWFTDMSEYCLKCDVDTDSLDFRDDFYTNFNNCRFQNNTSLTDIFHGGELIIDNCEFIRFPSGVNHNSLYPSFIYQTDGSAFITNSYFHIQTLDSALCTAHKNIGFEQAIIRVGATARVNNTYYDELKQEKPLALTDAPYNNRSYVFVKYYYPEIESCVYTSPLEGYEAKSFCYCLSHDDYVYKTNCKVTRAGTNLENRADPRI